MKYYTGWVTIRYIMLWDIFWIRYLFISSEQRSSNSNLHFISLCVVREKYIILWDAYFFIKIVSVRMCFSSYQTSNFCTYSGVLFYKIQTIHIFGVVLRILLHIFFLSVLRGPETKFARTGSCSWTKIQRTFENVLLYYNIKVPLWGPGLV